MECPVLPASPRQRTAVRVHDTIDALTSAGWMAFADRSYQGAHSSVHTPFTQRRLHPELSTTAYRAHTTISI